MKSLTSISANLPIVDIRTEVEILVCCARTCMDSKNAERLKILLHENIDWEYLIQTANLQGLMPLLYWNLNTTCPEAVPKATLAQLRASFEANAGWSLTLTGELLRLLELFATHEIPAIPFKGAVLAASAYGNLALRQFCDLDILVRQQDVLAAKDLLISQGYRLDDEWGWECNLISQDGRISVDLHQAITPNDFPVSIYFDDLWKGVKSVSLAGINVLSLSPEDLLLILCINIARDSWQDRERLVQICDVAEVIRVYQEMNWEQIIKRASQLNSLRMLFLGLLLAHDLLGANLPEEVLKRVQAEQIVKSLASLVCKWLFCQAENPTRGREKKLFYFQVRERFQDRVPYLAHLVHLLIAPSETDRAFLPLPTSLSFLYYLIRPIRVVIKLMLR